MALIGLAMSPTTGRTRPGADVGSGALELFRLDVVLVVF